MVQSFCVGDGFECFRDLHCSPRFCGDSSCSRSVHVETGRFSRRAVKHDFSRESFVVSARKVRR